MGALITLFILLAAVAIHEYGHYVAMRRNGVTVIEFSIGIGPILLEWKAKSGTFFRLRLIPLGGYVLPVQDGPGSMGGLGFWPRFRIFMAGMCANAIAAFLIFLPLYYATGRVHALVIPFIQWAPLAVQPIVAALLMSFGFWLAGPFLIAWLVVSHGLGFFTQDVMGPIGIVSEGAKIAAQQMPEVTAGSPPGFVMIPVWARMLDLFALIHVSLASFNLIPIMPLDGGQVARDLIKKKLGDRIADIYVKVGTVFMLAFIVFILASDLMKAALHLLR